MSIRLGRMRCEPGGKSPRVTRHIDLLLGRVDSRSQASAKSSCFRRRGGRICVSLGFPAGLPKLLFDLDQALGHVILLSSSSIFVPSVFPTRAIPECTVLNSPSNFASSPSILVFVAFGSPFSSLISGRSTRPSHQSTFSAISSAESAPLILNSRASYN